MAETESALPPLGLWWRGNGVRHGDGALIRANSSTVAYDNAAVPVGAGKWSIDFEYTAAAEASLWVVVVRHNADKSKVGEVATSEFKLPAASEMTRRTLEIALPESVNERWLPSLRVRPPVDVDFAFLKVYETPAPPPPAGPAVTVWDGEREVACTVTVWDGEKEIPANIEIQA